MPRASAWRQDPDKGICCLFPRCEACREPRRLETGGQQGPGKKRSCKTARIVAVYKAYSRRTDGKGTGGEGRS